MIYKETSLAKIVGQMSLSMNTDILTQPWVLNEYRRKRWSYKTGKVIIYTYNGGK